MQYMLVFREGMDHFAERQDPERQQSYWGAWMAYVDALGKSGAVVSGAGLQGPHTGAVVRMLNGVRQVQDGPYADSKEQLGGFFVIDVPDHDSALEWAARAPCAAYASVEVRPVLPPQYEQR